MEAESRILKSVSEIQPQPKPAFDGFSSLRSLLSRLPPALILAITVAVRGMPYWQWREVARVAEPLVTPKPLARREIVSPGLTDTLAPV